MGLNQCIHTETEDRVVVAVSVLTRGQLVKPNCRDYRVKNCSLSPASYGSVN